MLRAAVRLRHTIDTAIVYNDRRILLIDGLIVHDSRDMYTACDYYRSTPLLRICWNKFFERKIVKHALKRA